MKLLRWSTTGMRSIPHAENAGRAERAEAARGWPELQKRSHDLLATLRP
jgi:hypothetical protein